ncbi:Polynucleotide 5'-hydroxyl-kinase GRC3 [Zalerion maritima]|uniref:Polynucleotide 5'-hydroxyl-kinase GRC3 n=1 Tax=Zalerion maritima TaxID=339359 RepID=A0AAD5WPH7_9PEZI|nr:Polynucleotide 5'-hydroxyl-kinase GRC3 [Zalerion maritima]
MSSAKRKRDETTRPTMSAFAALQQMRSTPAPSPAATIPSTPEPSQDIPLKRQVKKAKNKEAKSQLPLSLKASESLNGQDQVVAEHEPKVIKVYSSALAITRSWDGSTLRVRMKQAERLVILGSYGLCVGGERGEIGLSGAILRSPTSGKPRVQWVHAPHSHAVPIIRCRSSEAQVEILSHPSAPNLRQMSRLNPVFRNLWDESCRKSLQSTKQTFHVIETSKDMPRKGFLQDLVSPPEWNQKLKAVEETIREGPTSVFVCGPKSSGKSTFSKLVCNKLLTSKASNGKGTEVAVLDIDPGQPEYSTAGLISLVHVNSLNLGASFTHPMPTTPGNVIVRSHAIASPSPASRPDFYVSCVLDLFSRYQAELGHLPLVVNTAGWIQGTGLDILATLLSKLSPAEVIYMSTEGPVDTVEALNSGSHIFSQLPSQSVEYASRTAAHLRTMQAMSYFHLASRTPNAGSEAYQDLPTLDWDPCPLVTRRPTVVRYSGKGGISGVLSYHHQPHPNDLADSILGRIVAIVELSIHSLPLPSPKYTPEGLPYLTSDVPLDPASSNALGLALIRGLDPTSRTMDVLSPISLARVSAAIKAGRRLLLVSGSFDLPTWFYTEEKYSQLGNVVEGEEGKGEPEMEIIADEDTSEDSLEAEDDHAIPGAEEEQDMPWVETLRGHQKRGVGAKVWRVRRDLGRK